MAHRKSRPNRHPRKKKAGNMEKHWQSRSETQSSPFAITDNEPKPEPVPQGGLFAITDEPKKNNYCRRFPIIGEKVAPSLTLLEVGQGFDIPREQILNSYKDSGSTEFDELLMSARGVDKQASSDDVKFFSKFGADLHHFWNHEHKGKSFGYKSIKSGVGQISPKVSIIRVVRYPDGRIARNGRRKKREYDIGAKQVYVSKIHHDILKESAHQAEMTIRDYLDSVLEWAIQ
jgi:hypothetical protein